MSTGLPQSIQTRLVRHAHALGVDPNLVLARYATERFLYRLSRSPHAGRFVLKGALMLLVWLGEAIRPTRDADLLGFGDLDANSLRRSIAEICAMPVEPDGLEFDAASIRVGPIRRADVYGGQRVTVLAHLGPARLRVQVDVGIGDAVVPAPEWSRAGRGHHCHLRAAPHGGAIRPSRGSDTRVRHDRRQGCAVGGVRPPSAAPLRAPRSPRGARSRGRLRGPSTSGQRPR